jgi:hypothetical protein
MRSGSVSRLNLKKKLPPILDQREHQTVRLRHKHTIWLPKSQCLSTFAEYAYVLDRIESQVYW